MAMLALLVSGVVIHRKLFREFFTLRWQRRLPRVTLDVHNVTGVLGLPFHFVMTFSGLAIFFAIYFPMAVDAVYGDDRAAFNRDAYGSYHRPAAGTPGDLASLDAMADKATSIWGEPPHYMRVWHPGDANAYVQVRRSRETGVSLNRDALVFDAATGELLQTHDTTGAMAVQSFIAGMHFIQFHHWPLRWLYFLLGMGGCAMIATGYIYWLETRRRRHGAKGLGLVRGLAVGSVTGIIAATLAFFIANRVLPAEAALAGYDRAALEVWTFYLTWLSTFAHAWLRNSRALREQCAAIAALAVAAVALNAATTGDHLLKTIANGHWPVAGMDLLLLTGAAVAAVTAARLPQPAAKAMKTTTPIREVTQEDQRG